MLEHVGIGQQQINLRIVGFQVARFGSADLGVFAPLQSDERTREGEVRVPGRIIERDRLPCQRLGFVEAALIVAKLGEQNDCVGIFAGAHLNRLLQSVFGVLKFIQAVIRHGNFRVGLIVGRKNLNRALEFRDGLGGLRVLLQEFQPISKGFLSFWGHAQLMH